MLLMSKVAFASMVPRNDGPAFLKVGILMLVHWKPQISIFLATAPTDDLEGNGM